jgi:hypothetical protein
MQGAEASIRKREFQFMLWCFLFKKSEKSSIVTNGNYTLLENRKYAVLYNISINMSVIEQLVMQFVSDDDNETIPKCL